MRIEKVKGKDLKLGMKVLNEDFEVGTVDYICDCEKCEERGFFEPTITYKDYKDFVTVYNKEVVFNVLKEISKAEKMFEELGYDYEKYDDHISYAGDDITINFYLNEKKINLETSSWGAGIRKQELAAINQQIEELGWK